MRRRSFLAGISSTALLASALPRISLAEDAYRPPKIIDAHCHVFNADDLPVVGFIEKVVLPQRDEFKKYETRYGNVVRFLVRYLADWLKDSAPSAADELVLLAGIKAGTAQPRTPSQIKVADIKHIADFIDRLKDLRINEESFNFREGVVSAYLPGIAVGLLHREAFPDLYKDTGLGNLDHAYDPEYWRDSEDIARALYVKGKGDISSYLRWGVFFTHFRSELADELSIIHGTRARLLTPALIDYSNWLNDSEDVKLSKQVEVMGQIARRKGGVRVHGYAPFDPLRDAIHRKTSAAGESPLKLVQRAVQNEGFIGVKLYPPMGFLPYNNARSLFAGDYPRHLRSVFGNTLNKELDRSLGELHAWCVAEQIPILAHAADSNGAGENYSKRADPSHWKAVTSEFAGIRVALAHFGDFELGFDRPGNRRPQLSDTWEWHMGALTRDPKSNQIYIDLSYLSTVLLDEENNRRKEVVRMLRGVRSEFREVAQRIVFGTDWIMFGKENAFSQYTKDGTFADRIAEFLADAGFSHPEIDAITYGNAANFLGLNLPADMPGSRKRLIAFYGENGLDPGWLTEIPVVSS